MNGKLEATALELATKLTLGYNLEIGTDRIVATSPEGKVHWYLFHSEENAQQIFERATKLIEIQRG